MTAPKSDGKPGFPVPGYEHCRIITVTLYVDDLAALDEMVTKLKTRGHSKAGRSSVIRHALRTVDLEKYPRQA